MSETLRRLTVEEIERFAKRRGVKRIAVENFLMSVTACRTRRNALGNVNLDARLYKWNSATQNAIRDGIDLATVK